MSNWLPAVEKFVKKIRSVIAAVAVPIFIFLVVFYLWLEAWRWIDTNITTSSTATPLTFESLLSSSSSVPAADGNTAAVRGQFGDKFGAINALFSGFAFAGIIFTIYLQRLDLRKTREAMSQERFDNTFFQLLQVHIAITEKISMRGGFRGREAFEAFNDQLKSSDPDFHVFCALQKLSRQQIQDITNSKTVNQTLYPELDNSDVTNLTQALANTGTVSFVNFLDPTEAKHEGKIVAAYTSACEQNQNIDAFSHYFRNLYHILKFIDESELISEAEKNRYSRFVRAQLSQVELVALFYNSISKVSLPGRADMELGYPKMGRLLQRFDMLQNMNPRSLIHPIHESIFNNNNKKAGDCHE